MCQEFYPRGVVHTHPAPGRHPLDRQPPLSRHTPLGRPPLGRHPSGRHPPPKGRRLLLRTVRILRECILVRKSFLCRSKKKRKKDNFLKYHTLNFEFKQGRGICFQKSKKICYFQLMSHTLAHKLTDSQTVDTAHKRHLVSTKNSYVAPSQVSHYMLV